MSTLLRHTPLISSRRTELPEAGGVARANRGRNANGESSIYYSKSDGCWHGYVTVGTKDNGRPDRRHRRGKTRAEVAAEVRQLERERDEGSVREAGQMWIVETWLRHWLETIVAPPAITENAYDAYEAAVRLHLIPGIGAHRLEKLEAEHLEVLYRRMVRAGASAGYAHQVHRTVRAALGEAQRRGRWAVALSLGLRQGEALGLQWSGVDFAAGILIVERNRLRPKYEHGCAGTCGRPRAGYCPQRVKARPDTAHTKSDAGRRVIGLPDAVAELLARHRDAQDAERALAADLWTEPASCSPVPPGSR